MKRILYVFVFLFIFSACEIYQPVDQMFLITEYQKASSNRAYDGCVIRYNLDSYYSKLSETVQRTAVERAVDIWRKINPNVLFVNSADTNKMEISVRFVDKKEIAKGEKYVPNGVLKTPVSAVSSLKQLKGLKYAVLLDNSYPWQESSITRIITYHIGTYLGFGASADENSVMNPVASNVVVQPTKEDSILYRQLYSLPCREINNESFPISFTLKDLVTRQLKTGKAGTITIRSTGILTVGQFIGTCTPDGKTEFTYLGLTFTIDPSYNLIPEYPHGAVIYKLNGDTQWRLCRSDCEFPTSGNEDINLTVHINDLDVNDNSGSYNVIVNYK